MKILQLIQTPQLRGAEVFASQLATHINNSGHQVVLVSIFPGNADLPFKGLSINLKGNKRLRLVDISAWKKLADIIVKHAPNIIQANAGDTLKYAVFSKIIFGWKQPIVFRNASTISLYIRSRLIKLWTKFLFRFTDKIISVSNTSANDFIRIFPYYENKIRVIPIGIEQCIKKCDDFMPKNSGKINRPQLLHVGGFTFEKNHKAVLRIFGRILIHIPNATLLLIGDGPLKKSIINFASELGLSDYVYFLGYKSNAIDYIQAADVVLLPSIIEGLPAVLLEAFLSKTPVVAYDTGGIKEIVSNGKTGRLIAAGDEEAFAEAVMEALENNPMNNYMVENAFQLVNTNYLNKNLCAEFIHEYKLLFS